MWNKESQGNNQFADWKRWQDDNVQQKVSTAYVIPILQLFSQKKKLIQPVRSHIVWCRVEKTAV